MINNTNENVIWGVIPDIHANMLLLETAIDKLRNGNVEHFAFLGDFIDTGVSPASSDDRGVLTKVRHLHEQGVACAVMGNHELNAILFHYLGADGKPLREHSMKNLTQHQSFIEQIGIGSPEASKWTEWFLTLPLWFEKPTFRLVHAYWGQKEIELISQRRPNGQIMLEDLPEIAMQNTAFGRAVQTLVCGPEIALPNGLWFDDFRGNRRYSVRVAWWRTNAKTWHDIGLSVTEPDMLPIGDVPAEIENVKYPHHAPPVFCGHYKMRGQPKLESTNVLCLDYPQNPHCYKVIGRELKYSNLLSLD